MKSIQIGTIVIAKTKTSMWKPGEYGICHEIGQRHDRANNFKLIPVPRFLFEGGGYSDFSPEQMEEHLETTGEICIVKKERDKSRNESYLKAAKNIRQNTAKACCQTISLNEKSLSSKPAPVLCG